MASKLISVNVSLPQLGAAEKSGVLDKLRSAGLTDANLLEAIGIVSGKIDQQRLNDLKQVPGVTVNIDDTIDIGPPDKPDTEPR